MSTKKRDRKVKPVCVVEDDDSSIDKNMVPQVDAKQATKAQRKLTMPCMKRSREAKPVCVVKDDYSSIDDDVVLLQSDFDPETFSDLEEAEETSLQLVNDDFCVVKFFINERRDQVKHYIGQIFESDNNRN